LKVCNLFSPKTVSELHEVIIWVNHTLEEVRGSRPERLQQFYFNRQLRNQHSREESSWPRLWPRKTPPAGEILCDVHGVFLPTIHTCDALTSPQIERKRETDKIIYYLLWRCGNNYCFYYCGMTQIACSFRVSLPLARLVHFHSTKHMQRV
jgi:hypothetical protein